MFSLIISIITITLVSVLALASIYYGGDAFEEGTIDAGVSTLIDQGQQVEAAVRLSRVNEESYTSIDDLVPFYLKENPSYEGNNWTDDGVTDLTDSTYYFIRMPETDLQEEVCKGVQLKYTSSDAYETVNTTNDLVNDGIYGCFKDADDGGYVFYFK